MEYSWRGELCFITDGTEERSYSADNLNELEDAPGFEEPITRVCLYKGPLDSWLSRSNSSSSSKLSHMYIVCKSQSWYWSIEKHADKITLQQSRTEDTVKDYFSRVLRHGVDTGKVTKPEETSVMGGKTIKQLLEWLCLELEKTYNVVECNCQDFAHDTFNYISNRKRGCHSFLLPDVRGIFRVF